MSCNKRAKQATVNRLVTIGVTTTLIRLFDINSYRRSFWSDFWQVTKETIRNDKQALPDFFKSIRCELNL